MLVPRSIRVRAYRPGSRQARRKHRGLVLIDRPGLLLYTHNNGHRELSAATCDDLAEAALLLAVAAALGMLALRPALTQQVAQRDDPAAAFHVEPGAAGSTRARSPAATPELAPEAPPPTAPQPRPAPLARPRTIEPARPEPAPAPPEPSLADEMQHMRASQLALAEGDPTRALALLEVYARTFPGGRLHEEYLALRAIARCDAGPAPAGRAEATAFLNARPRSMFAGNNEVEVMPLDLASKASIRAFAARFAASHDRLDVLVNNAGLWPTTRGTTKDGLETTFGVNHVGTWLLTQELLPLLRRSAPARIVVLSSALHHRGQLDWDDLQFERRKYNPTAAYNQSKLANVLFTKALARRLAGSGVTVNAVHPGVVTTELFRGYPKLLFKLMSLFLKTPEQGAACSLHVATAPELDGVSGEYFAKSRAAPAAAAAMDEASQERLWTLTESLAAPTHA